MNYFIIQSKKENKNKRGYRGLKRVLASLSEKEKNHLKSLKKT